jgi:multidrug efflux pump subunit AcrA (membrane-fusion protein)
MFVIVFLAARWLPVWRPLKPDARVPTFHQVDVNDPRFQLEQTSFANDNDDVRNTLREAVLDEASALQEAPCDDAVKAHYIAAATRYARAWISVAPCVGTRTCRQSDSARLDLAQKAFGSPFDRRVREAMTRAHQTGAVARGDFPDDAARLVTQLAGDGLINPDASPAALEMFADLRPTPAACRAASAQ